MNYEIVEIEELSGEMAGVYSIILENDNLTLFDDFIANFQTNHKKEILNILSTLRGIGQKFGAREQFFKLHEGLPGDGVACLFDSPNKKLRLFCVRWGSDLILLGNGGLKTTDSWQQDPSLEKHANTMIQVSKDITERLKTKEINFSANRTKFIGNLNFIEDGNE